MKFKNIETGTIIEVPKEEKERIEKFKGYPDKFVEIGEMLSKPKEAEKETKKEVEKEAKDKGKVEEAEKEVLDEKENEASDPEETDNKKNDKKKN